MDAELTYKILKYVALAIIVYFSLRLLYNNPNFNNIDIVLVSLIILWDSLF